MWIYQQDYSYMKNFYAGRINDHRRNTDSLYSCIEDIQSRYRTKHLLFTMGADFAFQYANLSFSYIEEVVKLMSEHTKAGRTIKFKYSTVQEYMDAVKSEAVKHKIDWPEYNGDFLPIVNNYRGSIWSGYFTSRPNFKQLIRQFSSISQVSQTFYGLQRLDQLRAASQGSTSYRLKS